MSVLAGKAAIVTGGGQGVGRGIALALAGAGASIVVVNNAHEVIPGAVLDASDDDIETMWSTGLLGVFNFMKAARPHLTRGASVINIVSSVMLKADTSGFALYAATKSAIRSLTRTVAVEWGGDGIRINALSPQTTSPAWPQWASANRSAADTIVGEIPLGYIGDAERDVGPVAVLLASDAARYVTGSVVLADGGRSQLR